MTHKIPIGKKNKKAYTESLESGSAHQKDYQMDSNSLWQALSKKRNTFPSLNQNIEVDVAVVGGGITGITAAVQLIKAGKRVALLESHSLGGVTSSSSTGNLYIAVQPSYRAIQAKFDLERVKMVAYSRQFAIDYIESQIQGKNIACHFKRRPWYAYTNKKDCDFLKQELELLKKIDLDVDYTSSLPLNVSFKQAIKMPNQARFNPLQYLLGLAQDLDEQGCLIFENTRVTNIEEDKKCTLTTESGKISAKKVILATHSPIGLNKRQAFVAPYRSYVVAVTLKDKTYPEGHFWDLDRPPHSLCTHPMTKAHPELLMVAGSHHKTGQGANTTSHFTELRQFLEHHFDVDDVVYQWSAQHFQSAGKIPYIGLASSSSKHIYMATGYFADGLVYGTLAGIILSEILTKKDNQFINTYNSLRHDVLKSLPFLFKENSNVFLQYLKDLPIFKNPTLKSLKNGKGCVVEIDQQKMAVSRDEKGELHVVSAICTHMKCVVAWNEAEQTWDCPCHGSRFSQTGEVIDGPAMLPLCKYETKVLDKDG